MKVFIFWNGVFFSKYYSINKEKTANKITLIHFWRSAPRKTDFHYFAPKILEFWKFIGYWLLLIGSYAVATIPRKLQ